MLQAFGNHTKGESLDARDGLVPVLTISHDARQRGYLSQPPAVVFPLDFNRKRHPGNVPSGWLSNKAMK
jgi:hypothetical protein